jgi:hypothetical protein
MFINLSEYIVDSQIFIPSTKRFPKVSNIKSAIIDYGTPE